MTIDDDVAAALERLRKNREASFKDIVNQALRAGLRAIESPPKPRKPYHTLSVDLGAPKLSNIDNVAEVLAIVEGDTFK